MGKVNKESRNETHHKCLVATPHSLVSSVSKPKISSGKKQTAIQEKRSHQSLPSTPKPVENHDELEMMRQGFIKEAKAYGKGNAKTGAQGTTAHTT